MAFSPLAFGAAAATPGAPASPPAAVQLSRPGLQAVALWQQHFTAGAAAVVNAYRTIATVWRLVSAAEVFGLENEQHRLVKHLLMCRR